ncbi:MAG: flagellar basal body P-ring formation chaperone FlgA [Candidatus Zixiibacteriota bacterium]
MISATTPVPLRRIARQAPIFRRLKLLLGIGLVLGWMGSAQAETVQSLSAIQQVAIGYLEGQHSDSHRQPQVTVAALDPRLRLAACEVPLEAFTPPGQRTMGATTVGVRCGAPVAWTVYVQATVALIRPVLVARRPLPRGTALTSADVDVIEQDVARLSLGYLIDLKDIDGMILRRSVTAGAVLHPALVQPPVSIRRGERVTILGQVAGIEVRMEGQAMADGAKGALIRVRNLSSGRDIEGVVVGPGLVQVRM